MKSSAMRRLCPLVGAENAPGGEGDEDQRHAEEERELDPLELPEAARRLVDVRDAAAHHPDRPMAAWPEGFQPMRLPARAKRVIRDRDADDPGPRESPRPRRKGGGHRRHEALPQP